MRTDSADWFRTATLPDAAGIRASACRNWLATAGALLWTALVAVHWPGWEVALALLASLVIVPLSLSLIGRSNTQSLADVLQVWASRVQLPAALLLAGSFTVSRGITGAAFAVPWFGVTLAIALAGLLRFRDRRCRSWSEMSASAGMIFLGIGGGWAVISRGGLRPMAFSDQIVLLTAVHFHYAGFVLPIVAGRVCRAVPNAVSHGAAAGVVSSVPLVAAGIAFSPALEWLGAWLLASAAVLVAILQLYFAQSQRGTARWLLAASSLSLLIGMALAAVYALGEFTGVAWLTIPQMLPSHGAINAFGFGLLSLLGWSCDKTASTWEPTPR